MRASNYKWKFSREAEIRADQLGFQSWSFIRTSDAERPGNLKEVTFQEMVDKIHESSIESA